MITPHTLDRRHFIITLLWLARALVNLVKFPYAVLHYESQYVISLKIKIF